MTDPIVDAVCAKLQARSAVGLKKYGTTLADNAATVKEKLVHAQEEAMDLANYLEWLLQDYFSYGVSPAMEAVKMMEKEMPTPMTIEMEVTKTPENVTCENLSNADEISLKNWVFAWAADVKGTPLDSDINDLIWVIEKHIKEQAALQSPRVPVIDGLDEAILDLIYNVCGRGAISDHSDDSLETVMSAARTYAELQKGV